MLGALEAGPPVAGRAGRGHRPLAGPRPTGWPSRSRPTAWCGATTTAASPSALRLIGLGPGRRRGAAPGRPPRPRPGRAARRDRRERAALRARRRPAGVRRSRSSRPTGCARSCPSAPALPLDVGSAGRLLADDDGRPRRPATGAGSSSVGEREAGVASVSAPVRDAVGPRRRGGQRLGPDRAHHPPARAAATATPWSPPPTGWSARPDCGKSDGVSERPLAAIDIGTNSFHMVVARVGEVEGVDGPAGPPSRSSPARRRWSGSARARAT